MSQQQTAMINSVVVPVGVFVYTMSADARQGKAQQTRTLTDKRKGQGVHNNSWYVTKA